MPEPVDGGEVSDVPDVECRVEDVHLLQLVDLRLRVAQPAVQAPVAVLGREEVPLVLRVLPPVPLLVTLQPRLLLELQRFERNSVSMINAECRIKVPDLP